MKIIFTKHTLQRLIERKIKKENIKEVIKFPDNIRVSFQNKVIVQKKIGNKILEVVYIKIEVKFIIITCYWL